MTPFFKDTSTSKAMQDIVAWRNAVVDHIDVLKTILAFKAKENAIPARALVQRAGPFRKDLEERARSKMIVQVLHQVERVI